MKTFDPAGASHINTNHTDRTRLAAHRAIARHSRETEYGPLPERMRLIILPISIFGAIGTPGQAFISELSRRVGGSVPPSLLPHASWPRISVSLRRRASYSLDLQGGIPNMGRAIAKNGKHSATWSAQ